MHDQITYNQLSDLLASLRRSGLSGDILTVDDMSAIAQIPAFVTNTELHCLCLRKPCSPLGTDFIQFFFASLSFSIKNGRLYAYKNNTDISRLFLPYDTFSKFATASLSRIRFPKSGYYVIIRNATTTFDDLCFDLLEEICEVFRSSSLNIHNSIRDDFISKLKRLHNLFTSHRRPTLENAVINLCEFIEEEEDLTCHFIDLDTRGYPTRSLPIASFDRLWQQAKNTGQPVAAVGDTPWRYCVLMPLLGRMEPTHFLNTILALGSSNRIKHDQVLRITEYIQVLHHYFFIDIKMQVSTDLQNRVIKEVRANPRGNIKALKKSYHDFAEECLDAIITTTRADSATLRLYNPVLKTLDLLCESGSKWGKRDPLHLSPTTLPSSKPIYSYPAAIPIKHFKTSANAFTFCRSPLPIYIPNTARLSTELKSRGLQSVIHSRHTKSELCFPLKAGEVRFGTINVESKLKDAFSIDLMYIEKIKIALETYYDLMLRASDAKWMAASGFVYMSLHKLKQYMRRDQYFNEDQKELLAQCITPERAFDLSKERKHLGDIKDFCKEVIYQNADSLTRDTARGMFRWNCKNELIVSKTCFDAVSLIAKNFIENVLSHGDPQRDTITVTTNSWPISNVSQVYVKTKTFGTFTDEESNLVTIAPLYKAEDQETHYGLFFVGMVSRLAGGTVWFSRHPRAPYTMIEVALPY